MGVKSGKKARPLSTRRAGILLPLTALPSPYAAGTIGLAARDFVDFLALSGQSIWQILPIGPTGDGFSPYQPISGFAGDPCLIDLDMLADDGLLTKRDISEALKAACGGRAISPASAAYTVRKKMYVPLLKKAAAGINKKSSAYLRFCEENEAWLGGYAAVCGDDGRDETKAIQYIFFKQWTALKKYANKKGVKLIGDLPFYVSAESADFRARPEAFDICEDGSPASVGGTPPDAFSKSGQIWNNPVYDWENHSEEVERFWRERIVHASKLYDGLRIDHFRAFSEYYAIPLSRTDDKKPEWRKGPGKPFIDKLKTFAPGLEIVAEDLGELSDEARELVRYGGFPGMKILQFAFSGDAGNSYLPHNVGRNSWIYTGTHDNDTLNGWARSLKNPALSFAMDYLGVKKREDLPSACIRAALTSRADTCIIPLQDWLGLGASARFNKPGTVGGKNWKWRALRKDLSPRLAKHIKHLTKDLSDRR